MGFCGFFANCLWARLIEEEQIVYSRALTLFDEPALWEMLSIAAHESSVEVARANPGLSRYVANSGCRRDGGAVALMREKERRLGPAGTVRAVLR